MVSKPRGTLILFATALSLCLSLESAQAITESEYEQLKNKIEQVRENDPELARDMEDELADAFESGDLELGDDFDDAEEYDSEIDDKEAEEKKEEEQSTS